jgi:hypothetical protein
MRRGARGAIKSKTALDIDVYNFINKYLIKEIKEYLNKSSEIDNSITNDDIVEKNRHVFVSMNKPDKISILKNIVNKGVLNIDLLNKLKTPLILSSDVISEIIIFINEYNLVRQARQVSQDRQVIRARPVAPKIRRGQHISMRRKQQLMKKQLEEQRKLSIPAAIHSPAVTHSAVKSRTNIYNTAADFTEAQIEEMLKAHAKKGAEELGKELSGFEIPNNKRAGRKGWRGADERKDIYYDCIFAYDQHTDCTAEDFEDDKDCRPQSVSDCKDELMKALTEPKMHVNRDTSELNKHKVWNDLVANIDYIKDEVTDTKGDGGTTGYNALIEKLNITPKPLWGEE